MARGLLGNCTSPMVIVPPDPGTFSALGMLLADARIDRTQTLVRPLNDDALADIRQVVGALIDDAREAMAQEVGETDIRFERQLELRYVGQKQSTAVRLASLDSAAEVRRAFDDTYRDRYGHANLASPAEIIGVQVTAIGAGQKPAP